MKLSPPSSTMQWKTRAAPQPWPRSNAASATKLPPVEGCSDTDVTPKPPWQKRKEEYIAHVRHASRSVRLVSAADKLHNARSILGDYRILGDEVWSRFSGGKQGTLWYYRALVDAYRFSPGEPTEETLLAELDRVVCELESLAKSTNAAVAVVPTTGGID